MNIKNMVCNCDIIVVMQIFDEAGINVENIQLGKVETTEDVAADKLERVKELLVYDEKTLSEIAWELGYSSVAYLSGQFKKVTGFTPSYYKKLGQQKRKNHRRHLGN